MSLDLYSFADFALNSFLAQRCIGLEYSEVVLEFRVLL
jgi:hypothetical protein